MNALFGGIENLGRLNAPIVLAVLAGWCCILLGPPLLLCLALWASTRIRDRDDPNPPSEDRL
jgi:hypothetical protein